MRNVLTASLLMLLCSLITELYAQDRDQVFASTFDADSLIAGLPRLISRQFGFTEGAAVDKKGNVFFTDQPNNKIWEYDLNGKLTLFLDSAGRSNGMMFDGKGNLVACADEHDQLWSISPDKKIKVLMKNYQGHRMNGPNDLWIDAAGGIYFTDPYFQRPYWDRTHSDLDGEKVYYLPKGKTAPVVAADNIVKPNGIVGTPDGKYLFIVDAGASKIYKYRISGAGHLTDTSVFVEKRADGIVLDERGNLYLAGDGVTVYNPAGKKVAHISIPEKWTANLCFGGKEKKDLFITASQGLYVISMRVRGVE
jgi:gluconolactonase